MQVKRFCPYCGQKVIEKSFGERVRSYCPRCDRIHYENPLPATAVLVINKKNELLLVKRSVEPAKGSWCLPGGFIEIDESIEQAALRELEEETGIKGEIDGLVDFFSQKSKYFGSILIFGYRARPLGGTLNAGDDAEEAVFFDLNDLPSIGFRSHQRLITKGYNQK